MFVRISLMNHINISSHSLLPLLTAVVFAALVLPVALKSSAEKKRYDPRPLLAGPWHFAGIRSCYSL